MTDTAQSPRGSLGIVAIALTLGAVPLMLWMGRWRMALLYWAIGATFVAGFIRAAQTGFVPMSLLRGNGPPAVLYFLLLPLSLAAIVHAFAIPKAALARPWYSRWYVAFPGVGLLSFIAALLLRTFLYQPFNSPSLSMWPTLVIGDYFAVSKFAYSTRDPQRGDIAVFRLPTDVNIDYVKRVVGLPGDRVQMRDGVLVINGTPVRMEPLTGFDRFKEGQAVTLFRETLPGGISYAIADTRTNGDADNTDEYVVPAGHYFVLGDNRDNAQDSRYPRVGYVPRENFVGPLAFRFWNDQGVPLAGRPE